MREMPSFSTLILSLLVVFTFILLILLILLVLGVLPIPSSSSHFRSHIAKPNDLPSIAHNNRDPTDGQWVEVVSWEPTAFVYHNFLVTNKVNIAEGLVMMKQRKEEGEGFGSKTKEVVPRSRSVPSPPPPPPLPKFWALSRARAEESVTKREIAKFWRQKRIEEEDHLLAATKAAARLRAHNLLEQEYLLFELSLRTDNEEDEPKVEMVKWVAVANANDCQKEDKDKEVRVGIKDWWTKSKYAYLNQPALDSMDPPKKRTSTYVPNCLSYKQFIICGFVPYGYWCLLSHIHGIPILFVRCVSGTPASSHVHVSFVIQMSVLSIKYCWAFVFCSGLNLVVN